MKDKIRNKGNIKHKNLIKKCKEGYCYKNRFLTIQEYLKLNRFYFNRNLG